MNKTKRGYKTSISSIFPTLFILGDGEICPPLIFPIFGQRSSGEVAFHVVEATAALSRPQPQCRVHSYDVEVTATIPRPQP